MREIKDENVKRLLLSDIGVYDIMRQTGASIFTVLKHKKDLPHIRKEFEQRKEEQYIEQLEYLQMLDGEIKTLVMPKDKLGLLEEKRRILESYIDYDSNLKVELADTMLAILKQEEKMNKTPAKKDNELLLQAESILHSMDEKTPEALRVLAKIAHIKGEEKEELGLIQQEERLRSAGKQDTDYADCLIRLCRIEAHVRKGSIDKEDPRIAKAREIIMENYDILTAQDFLSLAKIENIQKNLQGQIDALRHAINMGEDNNTSTVTQFARAVITRNRQDSKGPKDETLEEANRLLKNLNPNNLKVIMFKFEIAGLQGNTRAQINLKRREIARPNGKTVTNRLQLAEALLKECKTEKNSGKYLQRDDPRLIEANGLLNSVGEESYTCLAQKTILAELRDDIDEEIRLLRKRVKITENGHSLENNLIRLKMRLTSILIRKVNYISGEGITKEGKNMLDEAEQLLKESEESGENDYALFYKRKIAHLRGNTEEEIDLLQKMLNLGLWDKEELEKELKSLQDTHQDKQENLEASTSENNASNEKSTQIKEDMPEEENIKKSALEKYRQTLRQYVDSGDKSGAISVLNNMLEDQDMTDSETARIRTLLNLANSNKAKNIVKFKGEAYML